jgi:hypothetical protein
MNHHRKEDHVAMTIEDAVKKIADAYADAENKAGNIKTKFQNTKDAWEVLRDNSVIGGLEMQRRYRRLVALAVEFEAALYENHSSDTDRAKELSVDLPSIASGGR